MRVPEVVVHITNVLVHENVVGLDLPTLLSEVSGEDPV
jgi:hypothetical protein